MEILTALARRKHFARAAEECGVSQPAFSMRLRKIENGLGVALVKRGNRFQGFTSEGEALLRHAHKIMHDLKVMEQDIKSARGEISGPLSVGVIPTAVTYAARAIKRLQSRHPEIVVTLHTATSFAIQQGVDNGTFEAGFTYGEGLAGNLLQIDPVYEERYLLLAPKKLMSMEGDTVTWAQAAELPLCLLEPDMQNRRIIDKVFGDQGLAPNVIAATSGFLASIVLAVDGAAATIVPEQVAAVFPPMEEIAALTLVKPQLEMSVCLFTRARELSLPTVDALRSVCLE
ncbi:LysR family transcriptional regulator [Fluviibacterium sp. DFM31]|uniref:LysR family transcriptional regulator n=1 Tax=Meridianimarinicoccus marinus TaxID=3231483 RepID=A0ABV3LBC6_9RHOB